MLLYIFLFLTLSFGYSLFEKIKDKKGYTLFLANHLKRENLANLFWWILVFVNTSICIFLTIGIFQILFGFQILDSKLIFELNAIVILILLFGQRMAGDFQGAANLGIYFLIVIFGWYLTFSS
ncbi:hypothetical protein [Wenyingzhuangia sp. IMCC45574]